MKWTRGRLKEKVLFNFFNRLNIGPTEKDWKSFFKYSEEGILPESTEGLDAINEAKRTRDFTMNMWQEGNLDGSVPYFTLLGGEDREDIPPREVVDFMKKDMFGGMDSELIENIYQKCLNSKQ